MESSPVQVVRPRGDETRGRDSTRTAGGHDVDREREAGGGNALNTEHGGEAAGDIDLTALMQSGVPWKKRSRDNPLNTHLTTSIRRLEPPNRATSSTAGGTAPVLDDVGAGRRTTRPTTAYAAIWG